MCSNRGMETLPLDIISLFLKSALATGFDGFFNLLKAWARSQRRHLIVKLSEDLPISSLYKFGDMGSVSDISAFHQFMNVAEEMGIGDAIVYRSCLNLFSGSGSTEASFAALADLGGRGHFLAKVANWIQKNLYRRHTSVTALHGLVDIHRDPYYCHRIVRALASIKVIYSSVESSKLVHVVEMKTCCPIHSNDGDDLFIIDCVEAELCIFCELACMLNSFVRSGWGT